MAVAGGRLSAAQVAAAPGAPLDLLFAALPTAVLVIGADGRIAEANLAAEAMLNAGRRSLAGSPLAELIGAPLAAMPPDQPLAAYDVELATPHGQCERADLMLAPVPDHPGWRLLTLHRRLPQHLAGRRPDRGAANPAVAAAAMLAHEIRNPLSGIRGAAQLLGAGADGEGGALTRLIRDEVDRIAALIDRMEGFTDTRPLALEPLNVHLALAHVHDLAKRGFAAGCRIRSYYDPSLPHVLSNRDALVQIFLNLIKNAAEASEPRGEILVTTAYRHGHASGDRTALPIEVCVIDDGPGPPPDIAEHMFEPFVSSKPRGRGLGLALVDKLVSDLGGAIEYLRDLDPPQTRFRVLLPRARTA